MNRGDTFFAGHLHIVISNPAADGSVVVVNATTAKWDSDRNCEVGPNDHAALSHDSVIIYERARRVSADEQRRLESAPIFSRMRRASASEALIRRIQDGALVSDQTPAEIEEIVEAEVAARP